MINKMDIQEEKEATEFQGVKLTPLREQTTVSLADYRYIEKNRYLLKVTGLVKRPITLNYQDLLNYPQVSKLVKMDCVEGWDFTVKATGPYLSVILNDAGILPNASIVVFYTDDVHTGYTSLELKYILEHNIILGMKINDVTIPTERGFPFQVIAEGKYGYKWAKWVTEIEVMDNQGFRGYWEKRGYSNNAEMGKPFFEKTK